MPYEEFIDPDNRYFQITYRGDLTLEERIAAKARCITIRQERDIRRFFIDSSQIHQDIGAVGFTKFAYSFNKSEFPQGVKLAIFFKDDDQTSILQR
ncbi:hypothetical protein [Candidatus Reidiella endopervernicosa]|uniref:Uncharacterized protein n=1 Tax=Candidatus Reidiella endopervernicosa TaxID=2738883 RepID=A0A6N0HTI0_9GAMM|nr:hypothetical protein [Candidatus Reidiella endopervernicosa]QKQ25491.1 hypothetical protein HUE57_03640 [Candidatus Reidiella endopervernicosa]